MASDTIRVEGLDELQSRLRALGDDMERDIVRQALFAGQRVVRLEAQKRVPVDSGALRKSVRASLNRKAIKRGVVRVDLTAGNKTAWYAHLIEFGTASYYTGKGRTVGGPYQIKPRKGGALLFGGKLRETVTHPGIRPRPFMTPAADALEGPAIQAFAAEVRKRLMKYEVAK